VAPRWRRGSAKAYADLIHHQRAPTRAHRRRSPRCPRSKYAGPHAVGVRDCAETPSNPARAPMSAAPSRIRPVPDRRTRPQDASRCDQGGAHRGPESFGFGHPRPGSRRLPRLQSICARFAISTNCDHDGPWPLSPQCCTAQKRYFHRPASCPPSLPEMVITISTFVAPGRGSEMECREIRRVPGDAENLSD